jgi:hypothetical protein
VEPGVNDRRAVSEFFRGQKIDAVFMGAARVGGIYANKSAGPVSFTRT